MLRKFSLSWDNTNWGFILFMLAILLPALGVITQCTVQIMQGRALDTYNLALMGHPVFTNLGVSYLEVLIADIITVTALFIGLLMRYFYYRDERDFKKKYGVNGKTGFLRDFKLPQNTASHSDIDD